MSRTANTLLLVMAGLVLTLPLLGAYTLGGHDLLNYFMYGQQFAANMRDGVWLPAWASDLNYGFGSPALLFYPPLVNFTHALSLVAGIPLARGIGILTFVAALLSGLTARLWLSQFAETRGALAGSLLYMIAPYRLIDIYERTALAEHWSFIYPPLILWALSSSRPASQRIAIIAFATAALLMTNVPLAILFGLTIAAYAAVSRRVVIPVAGALLGFAMAAMSLIPQALASRLLRIELWFGGTSRFRASANTIFSSIGDDPPFNTRVSLVVLATALLALIAALATRKAFWSTVAAIAFLATIPVAGPLWDAVPLLSRLQFPWRAAAVLTLAAAALTAHVASNRLRIALVLLAAATAIPFYGKSMVRQERFEAPAPRAMVRGLFPDPRAQAEIGGVHSNNPTHHRLLDVYFIPRTAKTELIVDLAAPKPQLAPLTDLPAIFPADADARLRVTRWRQLERAVSIEVNRPGTLYWHSLAFPTMEFIVDGRATPAVVHASTGLATVALTAGNHEVLWRWRAFPELVLGRWISLAGVVVTLLIAGWGWRGRRGGERAG